VEPEVAVVTGPVVRGMEVDDEPAVVETSVLVAGSVLVAVLVSVTAV